MIVTRDDTRPTAAATGAADAAAANEAIRRYVRAHGNRPWGEREAAELARLRRVWLAAIRTAA
ncbi:hypothetical protein N0X72_22125 [Streptomyces carpaticus]|uniref:Uncharacterized protein n=1 Tax=Streptomyces cheonanensis TaxID=312720 RepID=A0ABN2V976_9ACTN|nr:MULTISPECIES: hypothetical protein [Streptomyces]MCK1813761.1 hypothetical protein [Streptomyces sp. XM4011]QKV71041.1 hypothetical protein HUT13_21455 [Streptomyces harbinensis]UWM51486.1 hypothetical protein N0X72_22125 [Streptomyces carpaticus]